MIRKMAFYIIIVFSLIFAAFIQRQDDEAKKCCDTQMKNLILQYTLDSLINYSEAMPKYSEKEKCFAVLSYQFAGKTFSINDSVKFGAYSYGDCQKNDLKSYIELLELEIGSDTGKVVLFNRIENIYINSTFIKEQCNWKSIRFEIAEY